MSAHQLPSLSCPSSIPVGYDFYPSFLSTCPQLPIGADRWAVSRQHVYHIYHPPSPYAVYTKLFSPSYTSTILGNMKPSLCTSSFITDTDTEEESHTGSVTEQAACITYFFSLSSYVVYLRRTLSPLHTSTIA